MYSYGPPYMAVQKQDDQHEHIFNSYVRIRDVVLKTCLGRWTIGRSGERGSGISVLPARHDDDDDDMYVSVYSHLSINLFTYILILIWHETFQFIYLSIYLSIAFCSYLSICFKYRYTLFSIGSLPLSLPPSPSLSLCIYVYIFIYRYMCVYVCQYL